MTDETTDVIVSTMAALGVDVELIGVTVGPSVIRYELSVPPSVPMRRIGAMAPNLAYGLACENVRVLAPLPNRSAIGVELPKTTRDVVGLSSVTHVDPLRVDLGRGMNGQAVTMNLADMPHLLVAGTTGSGKSSFLNAMLLSLLRQSPDVVRLLLIDPKQVELTPYDGVDHLLRSVVTDTSDAVETLEWLVSEMNSRYEHMRQARVRHARDVGLPYVVVVIDELSDLMMSAGKRVESAIVRLSQKARAAGIHVVLATQRPSSDVVTGLIKANVPSRLAFATATSVDSRVILGSAGAETLLGNGDALYQPMGNRHAVRIQGVYVTDNDVRRAVEWASRRRAPASRPPREPEPSRWTWPSMLGQLAREFTGRA